MQFEWIPDAELWEMTADVAGGRVTFKWFWVEECHLMAFSVAPADAALKCAKVHVQATTAERAELLAAELVEYSKRLLEIGRAL